jgi:hypothetical protein
LLIQFIISVTANSTTKKIETTSKILPSWLCLKGGNAKKIAPGLV